MSDAVDLSVHPIHLGLGATAVVEPEFTGGGEWYAGYGQRHDATDGAEGRLVSSSPPARAPNTARGDVQLSVVPEPVAPAP